MHELDKIKQRGSRQLLMLVVAVVVIYAAIYLIAVMWF